MLKVVKLLLLGAVVASLWACSLAESDEETGSITFSFGKMNARSATSSEAKDAENTIEIALKGDYEEEATLPVSDGAKVTFDNLQIGKKVYATASVYKATDSEKTELYRGKKRGNHDRRRRKRAFPCAEKGVQHRSEH